MILAVLYDSLLKKIDEISRKLKIKIWSIPALFYFNLEMIIKINRFFTRGKVKTLFKGGPK